MVINVIAFQCGWFAAVLGGAHDFVVLGTSVALLVMVLHVFLSHRPWHEIQLLCCVMILGLIWDSALASERIIQYFHGQVSPYLAPVWIVVLWGLFATTLNVSLRFLKRRYFLAALFGVVGAPLSFMAGARLNALQFPDLSTGLLVLAVGWGLLMMLMVWLSDQYDGVTLQES